MRDVAYPQALTMNRDEVIALVKAHRAELQQLGVRSLDLFGSVARNEARSDSDVDFLIEFAIEASLFDLFRVKHYLEDLLNKEIDLGTQDSLREHLREPILRDLVHVF